MRIQMSVAALVAAVSLAACGDDAPAEDTASDIAYTFTYAGDAVEVSLAFEGDGDGETLLVLPNEWGGETELYRTLQLNGIQGAAISEGAAPYQLNLSHEPGAWVTVNYRVIQDWDGIPTAGPGNPYRPVIQPDYVHMIGWTMLIVPEFDAGSTEHNITLNYDGWPADWTIVDNLDAGTEPRSFTGDINRIQAGLFVAGDFRLTEAELAGAPFRFALRGDWDFFDTDLINTLEAVVAEQREFWGDEDTNPFLVTLIPLDNDGNENSISWGGTGLVDSFALFATPNTSIEDFRNLGAHEFMHNWIPGTFGMVADPEAELYWFSEGFTDYFATLLQLRAGLIDLQGFADQNNAAIRDYYRSPWRGTPNAEVAAAFWNDRDANRYPYLHGRLFAVFANREVMDLHQGDAGVESVLLWWREYRREQFGEPLREEFSTYDVQTAFINSYATGVANGIQRHIVNGEPVAIEDGMFGPCFDVVPTEFAVYDLGIDHTASYEALTVTGVTEGGPAWNAGLRNGMAFGGYSIMRQGDPDSSVTFWAQPRGGEMQEFTYLPQSSAVEVIPQIVLQDPLSAAARDECLAWWDVE